ncbi:MAG: molecular chaperone DnaJ [Caulobacteraceae bacterium]|nr:molecular chaperone DnaJ [Caulobacter sp.]
MWLAVLLVLLGALWGVGGPRRAGEAIARGLRRAAPGAWRPGAGLLALVALLAALVLAVRLDWLPALVAAVIGAVLAASARRRGRPARPSPPSAGMSRREAASVLGVAEGAGAAEVQDAYARLMRRAHPDVGGSAGLAAQLNLARSVMLGR